MGVLLEPSSSIQLLRGVNLSPSYNIVYDFTTMAEQTNYFTNKVEFNFDNCTFVREKQSIKINAFIEDIMICNYLRYKNSNGKWIYCFITDKVFISHNVTELVLKTDVFQTYMFDFSFKDSYIVRSHNIPTDKTLLYENFDLGGEYELIGKQTVFTKENAYMIILSAPTQRKIVKDGKIGLDDKPIEVVDIRTSGNGTTTIQGVPTQLLYCPVPSGAVLNSVLDSLKGCTCLLSVVKLNHMPSYDTIQVDIPIIKEDLTESSISLPCISGSLSKEEIQEITLKEVKIDDRFNCYPYTYSMLTDYVSNPLIIKREYMSGSNFGYYQSISTEPSTRYYLNNYCGDVGGKIHNITTNNVVSIPLASDRASEYLANNKNAIEQQMKQSNLQSLIGMTVGATAMGVGVASAIVTGGASLPILGAIGGGLMSFTQSGVQGENNIKNHIAKMQDISNMPPSITTTARVGNEQAFNIMNVDFLTFSIKDSIKTKILEFWNEYGYKNLTVGEPSLRTRGNFDYLQTQNVGINTDVMTASDIIEMENIFNQGVKIIHK